MKLLGLLGVWILKVGVTKLVAFLAIIFACWILKTRCARRGESVEKWLNGLSKERLSLAAGAVYVIGALSGTLLAYVPLKLWYEPYAMEIAVSIFCIGFSVTLLRFYRGGVEAILERIHKIQGDSLDQ